MITYLFHPSEDELSLYPHDDFQSSLQSCNSYPFGDSELSYEYFQPPFRSDFDGYKVMSLTHQSNNFSLRRSERATMFWKEDLFLPMVVPYLFFSDPWILISHLKSSLSSGCLYGDEDEPSSIYDSPLQRWIDRACGYHFQVGFPDDHVGGFPFQQISSLPPISMNFIS
jgi:hypothetical protein